MMQTLRDVQVKELTARAEKAEAERDQAVADAAGLRVALGPFIFLAKPKAFNSHDGGVTETLICDSDVQYARQALSGHPGDKLLANYEKVKQQLRRVWKEDCAAAKEAKATFFAALDKEPNP